MRLTPPSAFGYYRASHRESLPLAIGGERMTWEAPDFIEVKMDAEINSYQDDFGQEPDDRF
jgi:hypothetical protein